MGILIDPTPAQPDRGGAVKPGLEAVGHLLSLSFGDAAGSGYDAIKEFRTKTETLEQRVWTLWRESLALALPEFFVTASLTREPDNEELARLLAEILAESETLAKAGRAEFMDVHRRTPTDFPLYPPLREKLPGWARKVAPEHLRDDERLRERLDRAFERGFRRAIADRGDHFAPILDFFEGEEAEPGKMRDAWQRYYDGLSQEIECEPLFNQPEDGSGATLGAIFQPLRCHWRIRAKSDRRDITENNQKPDDIHIAWLQATLEAWLDQRNGRDALRVVTGGPGSGKSSSALWFARDAALLGSVNVFIVSLQGMEVNRPVDEIVADYRNLAATDHTMLDDSPIHWLQEDPKPLLLVFDGLDEVARPDGAGLEVTKSFLRALESRLSLANGGKAVGRARLMALVLGRPQAAEEAARAMGGLADKALLHVAPLCPLDENVFAKDSQRSVTIHDPSKLADEDFRAAFYERYRPFDQHCDGDGAPEALRDDQFVEMTVEPLLLYLLIVSGYAGKNWALAKDNRNRVYQQIFSDIHQRDLQRPGHHPAKIGIDKEEDFFLLMECLGLAAWQGGGRSGSDEDFATFRDRIYITKRGGRFKDKKSADLKNVAVQTFAHRGDGDKPGYAFIHKSFGEYLTARALIEAGDAWLARHEGEPEDFAKDWLQPAGGARITFEIMDFMIAEARLRLGCRADADRRLKALTAIASYTLDHGFPAHGELLIADKGVVDWRRREGFQRNAELSLYTLIHAWAEAGYPLYVNDDGTVVRDWEPGIINVVWPEKTANPAAAMFERLRDQWAGEGYKPAVFARWDFAGQSLEAVNLRAADLRGADMGGMNLWWTNLHSADLRGADLRGAQFSVATMIGTRLEGANLRWAKLIMAKLRGASLRGADLSEANLGAADLNGADLKGANCDNAHLRSARLHTANLSGVVNLTQKQIDKAYGNSETKLPDGLKRPAHWKDEE